MQVTINVGENVGERFTHTLHQAIFQESCI